MYVHVQWLVYCMCMYNGWYTVCACTMAGILYVHVQWLVYCMFMYTSYCLRLICISLVVIANNYEDVYYVGKFMYTTFDVICCKQIS